MLRVALVFEYGTLNGGERSMLAVIDRLAGRECEFTALAPSAGRLATALRERGIKHVPLALRDCSGSRLPRKTACQRLVELIGEAAPDLVHANSLATGRLTGAIAARLDVPCAVHLRDILRLSRAAVAELNRNRLLIAVSHATREYHLAQGLDAGRVRVIYNGVDCERFRPRRATGRLKRELGVSQEAFLIGTIGQIGLRKGQDVLAAAAAIARGHKGVGSLFPLRANNDVTALPEKDSRPLSTRNSALQMPDAHFVLIGERHSRKPESVEFERTVVRRFQEAGLGERFHRLGYRDDVDSLMNELDLLVHPAHQEPLGRVLLEAAACGLPIVATNVGGTGEIFTDGRSARLVPPGDPQALAREIAALYADPEDRRRLGVEARNRVGEAFDVTSAASALLTAWQACRNAASFPG